ncbi:MAG: hypothetical protein ACUVS3_05275 [Thermodesulfobacteriota bacterium]
MEEAVREAQRLRLRRFGMALATYALVTIASFVTQRLGLGRMSLLEWGIFVAIAIVGNAAFLTLFLTGRNLRFRDPSLTREQIVYSAIWGLWAAYHLPQARSIVLMFYVPAFCSGILRFNRRQDLQAVAVVMTLYGAMLALEYVQDRPGFELHKEIFLFVIFGILFTWLALFGGFVSDLRRRLRLQNLEIQKANEEIRKEIEQRSRAEKEKDRLLEELREALANMKTLRGLIPICAWCRKIRDDTGYWKQLEEYLKDYSEAELSHGICPECAAKMAMTMESEGEDG